MALLTIKMNYGKCKDFEGLTDGTWHLKIWMNERNLLKRDEITAAKRAITKINSRTSQFGVKPKHGRLR